MEYDILLCKKCGWVNAGRTGAATFTCPHCGARNASSKCVVLARKVKSGLVPETMGRIKMERANTDGKLG
jgi:predicted RNA-binding Zn-ribbon protein involved in translation (DUF1610 family)